MGARMAVLARGGVAGIAWCFSSFWETGRERDGVLHTWDNCQGRSSLVDGRFWEGAVLPETKALW